MAEREIFRSLTEGRVVIGRPLVHQEESRRLIQEQRQAYELELRRFTGDDPLEVWDRYLKWTLQTYPERGKESGLKDLLERAVQQLSGDNKYYNDPRYVSLWIMLAQNSLDPLEMFSYMQARGIGLTQAALYIAWAEEYMRQGNFQKADAIFQEGLKCRAQPLDKLQIYQMGFHARVSGQVMSGTVDKAEEDRKPEPARTSMVDLRPRKRKYLFNRAEASVGAAELKPEPGMVPASSRTKENEVMPENGASIQVPQRLSCPSSCVPDPPSRPRSQPVPEAVPTLSVSGCPMDLAVSAGQPPAREEVPVNQQSMYLREQLLGGPIELSFEELRAENYFKRNPREIEERIQKQKQTKEWLRQQIEEKTRLLQMKQLERQAEQASDRDTTHWAVTCAVSSVTGSESVAGSCSSSAMPFVRQNAAPFQIFDEGSESVSTHASGSAAPRQLDMIPDDVFLRPGERGLCFMTPHPLPGGNIPQCKRTLSKNFPDKSVSLSEEVVDGHANTMLCASPEDTLDFAKAAKMASSPYTCGTGEREFSPETGAVTKDPVVPAQTDVTADERKKLSPIQEASLEVWSSMTSTSSHGAASGGKPDPHLSRCGRSLTDPLPEGMEQTSPSFPPVLEDSCSVSKRRQILEQVDLSSFPDFSSADDPLPLVEEHDVLVLGNVTFALNSKTDFQHFSIFEGWSHGDVAVKVEHCAVPWDFYIGSQLRERLARDSQGPSYDAGRCFLFRDGCITVQKACQMRTLREVTLGAFEDVVVSVAIQTVDLVRRMHSCHLIHGALSPDTLVVNRLYDDPLDELDGVVPVDFSCSVDLERQPEVTEARNLTAAQDFIQQGLLSPTASPYQVDLLGLAETVCTLLRKRSMRPVKDGSEWTLEEYQEADPSDRGYAFWSKFFRTLLNPGDRSSVSVLMGLLEDMKKSEFA
ncbi:mitotic checkpoint serine/threonine-protein kinase BUB1 beta [Esox lucius]|uniref:BUB1 N-terminal domain-containing protein n=1 Tax=Esox lucius TaxID=8010 RepID=A0AAY5JX19_ESOLU|nr:mitotic checkpoint serine/threonine-protein kinase BUB1 beta [Esox lucius]XP_012992687.2 mitotic checkpoint serine/threonine-protein kinase BUB1 beta [Esox lucius]